MTLIEHPDGQIVINGRLIEMTVFQQVVPSWPGLPPGAHCREYLPGVRHTIHIDDTVEGGPLPWPEGDAVLADEANILAQVGAIENPPPSLDEVRVMKLNSLTADYLTAIDAGVTYQATTFQCDDTSEAKLNSVLTAIGNGWTLPVGFVWRDAANVDHPADTVWLQGLAQAMADNNAALYSRLQAAKDAARAAATAADINTITF